MKFRITFNFDRRLLEYDSPLFHNLGVEECTHMKMGRAEKVGKEAETKREK